MNLEKYCKIFQSRLYPHFSNPQLPFAKLKDFENKELIATGSYGTVVHKSILSTGDEIAMKSVPKTQYNTMSNEIKISLQLGHQENMIQFFDLVESKNHYHIISELANECLLDKIIQETLPLSTLTDYFLQICHCVQYIHRKHIVHADIKLDNIVLSNGKIKLIDFGHSFQGEKEMDRNIGTCGYKSPEILKKNKIGKPIDIWALGVIYYQMFFKSYPFYENDLPDLKMIKSVFYETDKNSSKCHLNLLKKMWEYDPDKRIDIDQLIDMIN